MLDTDKIVFDNSSPGSKVLDPDNSFLLSRKALDHMLADAYNQGMMDAHGTAYPGPSGRPIDGTVNASRGKFVQTPGGIKFGELQVVGSGTNGKSTLQ